MKHVTSITVLNFLGAVITGSRRVIVVTTIEGRTGKVPLSIPHRNAAIPNGFWSGVPQSLQWNAGIPRLPHQDRFLQHQSRLIDVHRVRILKNWQCRINQKRKHDISRPTRRLWAVHRIQRNMFALKVESSFWDLNTDLTCNIQLHLYLYIFMVAGLRMASLQSRNMLLICKQAGLGFY